MHQLTPKHFRVHLTKLLLYIVIVTLANGAVYAQPTLQLAGKRIVLDPGHGWRNDPGAQANGMVEADITLDVAQRTKRILEQYGAQVMLTRTTREPNVGLEVVDDRANAFEPDIVVSIHVNAGGGTGTESCYVVNKPTSTASHRLARLLTAKISAQLELRIRGNFRETVRDRCGKGRYLYIHWIHAPTALVELAFIDGPIYDDVAKLRDRRQDFAQAIADAVTEYLGGEENLSSPPPGYSFCAQEGERCRFHGIADVAYGANGQFFYRFGVEGSIECSNTVFGDPIFGVRKACYIKAVSSARNLARGKKAYASSVEQKDQNRFGPQNAFDGDPTTRWSSLQRYEGGTEREWIWVDLGEFQTVNKIILRWEAAFAKRYTILAWYDGKWQVVTSVDDSDGGIDILNFSPITTCCIGLLGLEKANESWGYSLWEFEVYNEQSSEPQPQCRGTPIRTEQRVEGILNNRVPNITYCLQARAGQIVSIRMFALDSDLDTWIKVFSDDGQLITENDDGINIGYNSFLTVQFPRDGIYRIVATRYGQTQGKFALRVEEGFEAAVGDLDRDCDVDTDDQERLRSLLGKHDPNADLDLDGAVLTRDYIFLTRNLGIRCQ